MDNVQSQVSSTTKAAPMKVKSISKPKSKDAAPKAKEAPKAKAKEAVKAKDTATAVTESIAAQSVPHTPAPATAEDWNKFSAFDSVSKSDVLHVPLHLIRVSAGFNPRDMEKTETKAKIKAIKESFKQGLYVKPLEVMLNGDHVEIVDGEGRFTAAKLADAELKAEKKPGIDKLVCIPFAGGEVERLILTVHGNEGEKLTQLEQSEVVRRLQAMGWKRDRIAKTLGFSIGWIDRLIVLMKMPEPVKKLVQTGKVAPDVAAEYFKKHGENAEAELKALLAAAKEERVTKKDAKKAKGEQTEREPSAKKVKMDATIEAAVTLGENLPDFGIKKSALRMTEVYKVELTGKALKALLSIQEMYAPDEPEGGEEDE